MSQRSAQPAKRVSRSVGQAEVLDVIRSERVISRMELARRVSVSRAALSGIVAEMLRAGLLEETGKHESSGGRPSGKLSYRPESRLAVGVVLFDDEIRATLTDLDGKPLNTLDSPLSFSTPDGMLQAIQQMTWQVLQGTDRAHVLGVGIGMPGVVDFSTGILDAFSTKGWFNLDLNIRDALRERLALPVFVANRSRVAALGEQRVGVGRGATHLIYLYLGQGIVAGIVLDGQLYLGALSSAGEIGHVSLDRNGPLCACGNRGCLSAYATQDVMLARARAMAREHPQSRLAEPASGRLESLTLADLLKAAQQSERPP
jgi:predicted NBD/HSP70 family sugar kinase